MGSWAEPMAGGTKKGKAKPTPFHSWVIHVEMQKILSRIFVVNLSGGNRHAYASPGDFVFLTGLRSYPGAPNIVLRENRLIQAAAFVIATS